MALPRRTLKFPLVAGTQPFAWHQRAVAQSESISLAGEAAPELVFASGIIRESSVPTGHRHSSIFAFYNDCLNDFVLHETQRERIAVVLVSPRNPLNIGAAARAMSNFGFGHLTVVAPYALHWREARSAVGAPQLLRDANETTNLDEAVANSTLVIGTGTLTTRKPEQQVVSLPALNLLVQKELDREGRIAVVFGPEKHGLTREDLSHCHLLVEIPTDARQPSMNLGQAVAVCLYELTSHGVPEVDATHMRALYPSPLEEPAAPSGQLDILAEVIEKTMIAADYSPAKMHAANRHDLRLVLRRSRLNPSDIRRILGLFRRILWRIQHDDDGPNRD
jgi:TrmH family RNA methyltransferase